MLVLKEETLSMIKTSQFYQLYSLALPFSEFLSCSVIIPGVPYWLTTAGRKEDYGHFQGFSTPRFMLQNPPFFSPKKSLALYYYTIHRSNY